MLWVRQNMGLEHTVIRPHRQPPFRETNNSIRNTGEYQWASSPKLSAVFRTDYGIECHIPERSDRSIQSGCFFIQFLSSWLSARDIFCCLCSALHTCSGRQLLCLPFQGSATVRVLLWGPSKHLHQSWPVITVSFQTQLLHILHVNAPGLWSKEGETEKLPVINLGAVLAAGNKQHSLPARCSGL